MVSILLYGIVFVSLTTLRDAMIYDMSDSEPNNNMHLIACFLGHAIEEVLFISRAAVGINIL